jgi:hypothetical protein
MESRKQYQLRMMELVKKIQNGPITRELAMSFSTRDFDFIMDDINESQANEIANIRLGVK